jgi:hypothetical protein
LADLCKAFVSLSYGKVFERTGAGPELRLFQAEGMPSSMDEESPQQLLYQEHTFVVFMVAAKEVRFTSIGREYPVKL